MEHQSATPPIQSGVYARPSLATRTQRPPPTGGHLVRGHTIIEEITRLRLERVKRLLVETELPIKEIAANSGYNDDAQLCTSFRKVEGLTPGAYRTKHTGAPKGPKTQTQSPISK